MAASTVMASTVTPTVMASTVMASTGASTVMASTGGCGLRDGGDQREAGEASEAA